VPVSNLFDRRRTLAVREGFRVRGTVNGLFGGENEKMNRLVGVGRRTGLIQVIREIGGARHDAIAKHMLDRRGDLEMATLTPRQ